MDGTTKPSPQVLAYSPGSPLPALYGLRGMAALLVMVFHVRYVPMTPAPPELEWILSTLGYSVQLFFVLSALSLMHMHYAHVGQPNWLLSYAVKRYFRIAPLFYLMLAICWPLFGPTTAWGLVSHILFLFNLDPELGHSIVPAGWAVGVEMLAYVLLPLAMVFVTSLKRSYWVMAASIVIGVLWRAAWAPPIGTPSSDWSANHVALYTLPPSLAFFAAGIVAFHLLKTVVPSALQLQLLGVSSVAGMLALAAAGPLTAGYGSPETLLWAIPFAGLCVWQTLRPSRFLSSPAMCWIGERSFSVYLLHDIIVYVLYGFGVYAWVDTGLSPWLGTGTFFLCVGLTAAIVLPIAACTYQAVERPGQRLGAALLRRMQSHPSASRAAGSEQRTR